MHARSLPPADPAVAAPPPLWEAARARILSDMAAGRLADGARLPPEREMAAAMGLAVGTLRRALGDLARRGLLERRQGSGNYVRAAGLAREVYGFFRLERPGGGLPSAAIVSLGRLPTPAGLAPWGAAPAWRIRRLRRIGGEPVAAEEIWLDGAAAGRLEAGEIGDSLYLHYGAALGLRIEAVTDRIGLGAMPPWAPAPLEPDAVAGLVARESRDGAGAVREVSRTWFDPARASYVSRLGRPA